MNMNMKINTTGENIMKTTESTKTTMKASKIVMTAMIAMSCLAGNAFASIIVQPISYTSIGGPQNGSVDETIDGDGLSSALNTGDAVPGVLPTHESMYPSGGGTTGVRWFIEAHNNPITDITFNLGAEHDLESVLFWNYNETQDAFPDGQTQRGISSVTASFSTDGLSFTGATTLNFAESSGLPIAGETVSMVASDVQYVKFTDFANHGDTVLAGFSEIRFTAIPEPATTSMLLGLGASLMVFLRRRLH